MVYIILRNNEYTPWLGIPNEDLLLGKKWRGRKKRSVSVKSGIVIRGTSYHPLVILYGCIGSWYPFSSQHSHPQILRLKDGECRAP